MRYFISLLSSLMKSLAAVVPLSMLVASSCPSEKQEIEALHPYWSELNEPEDKLPENKCLITKFGLGGLRFHITHLQQCFNANDFYGKSKGNIVQAYKEATNWVLTPNFYGSVTQEKFPKTMQMGMKYRFDNDDQENGIPFPFLEEWLAIDPIDYKEVTLIISKGIEGRLGVSESLKKALKDKQAKGEIQDYKILKSGDAVMAHNQYVKEGRKVFTFIHTVG